MVAWSWIVVEWFGCGGWYNHGVGCLVVTGVVCGLNMVAGWMLVNVFDECLLEGLGCWRFLWHIAALYVAFGHHHKLNPISHQPYFFRDCSLLVRLSVSCFPLQPCLFENLK